MPVRARAGSVEKVAMLTVRYCTGVPLWNPQDGLDTPRLMPTTKDELLVAISGDNVSASDADQISIDADLGVKSLAP